jgi:ABC transporter transmembrane region
VATQCLCVAKCLARMHIEIGDKQDGDKYHPLFWIVMLMTTLFAYCEASYIESVCNWAGKHGKQRMTTRASSLFRRISSTLSLPLLSGADSQQGEDETDTDTDGSTNNIETPVDPDTVRGSSDIGADANYKANWRDLLATCTPDLHYICLAFCFLLLAAVAQVYIPRYLGKILDALAATFADHDSSKIPMEDVPGFIKNIKLLVIASVAAGIFAGLRGSIFTVVGARVNVRLRIQLMDALLSQDIGFFDVTKTGDITSRLSSDTTLVGDQVSLNVNVFLRSLVQAVGVLLFMFLVSWQLSIIAFVSVPLITHLSKVYGQFIRGLTKLMQKKLAEGNSVSEAALGSMATVRSFDAAELELREFEMHMKEYLRFNLKSAVAYSGYAAFTTSVPQLVFAVVGECVNVLTV